MYFVKLSVTQEDWNFVNVTEPLLHITRDRSFDITLTKRNLQQVQTKARLTGYSWKSTVVFLRKGTHCVENNLSEGKSPTKRNLL